MPTARSGLVDDRFLVELGADLRDRRRAFIFSSSDDSRIGCQVGRPRNTWQFFIVKSCVTRFGLHIG